MRDMSKWHYCPSADEGVHLFGRPPFTGQLGDPQPGGDAVDVDIVRSQLPGARPSQLHGPALGGAIVDGCAGKTKKAP